MKKTMFVGSLLACVLSAGLVASAAEAAAYVPGVTVEEDEASATGYTVTFVYEGGTDGIFPYLAF